MDILDSPRAVVAVLRKNFAPFIAGSLAYSAFMSFVPLLTLVLIVAGVLGDESLVDRTLALSEQYLTSTIGNLFEQALEAREGRVGASLLSVALILWSSLRVFRGMAVAFSMFYGTEEQHSFLENVRDALLVLLSLGVALVAAISLGAITAFTSWLPYSGYLAPLLLVVPLLVAFVPIYYVFPDVDVTVGEILPGAIVAAVGWGILQGLFQVYVSQSGGAQVYGPIGAVLLALTWLYLASLLLLVGVAVNVVLSGRASRALSGTRRAGGSSVSD